MNSSRRGLAALAPGTDAGHNAAGTGERGVNHIDDVIRPMLPGEAAEVSRIIVAAIRAGLPGHYAPEVVHGTFLS